MTERRMPRHPIQFRTGVGPIRKAIDEICGTMTPAEYRHVLSWYVRKQLNDHYQVELSSREVETLLRLRDAEKGNDA